MAAPITITTGDDSPRAEVDFYRPLPGGWPRARVGRDRSVWVLEIRAGVTPAPPKVRKRRQRYDTAMKANQVPECRRLYSEGWSYKALADRYGCGVYPVWAVLTGLTFAHVDGPRPEPAPRWKRLEPFCYRSGPSVRLYDGDRCEVRSVELLFLAAFDPSTLTPATIARLAPRGPRPPTTVIPPSARPAIAPPRPPAPPIAITALIAPPAVEVPELAPVAELPDDDEGYRVGSRHGRAKLDEAKVIEARRLHRAGWSYPALAQRFRVGKVTLFYAISGRTWSHVPMEE